jgi:hypothetical protein
MKIVARPMFVAVAVAGACALGCSAQSNLLHPSTQASAAQAREIEASACSDVPAADRDLGPLGHRDRISGVEVLQDRPYPKQMLQPAGVAIYVRATPGMTEQWLSRVLECHMAHEATAMASTSDRHDPFLVEDARVALSPTSDGFRITITTKDVGAAREIIDRARVVAGDPRLQTTAVARNVE